MTIRLILSRVRQLTGKARWQRKAIMHLWADSQAKFADGCRGEAESRVAFAAAAWLELKRRGNATANEEAEPMITMMVLDPVSHLYAEETATQLEMAHAHLQDARRELEIEEYRTARREHRLAQSFPWLKKQPKALAARNERMLGMAQGWFDCLRCVLPRRVADEELGDELELMAEQLKDGGAISLAMLKLISATIFVALNSFRYVLSVLWGGGDRSFRP